VQSVNVKGTFNVTKYSILHMKKANYGRILLIASIAGKEGNAVGSLFDLMIVPQINVHFSY
jgi:NADP-dependent 3-hydroxy acid dehydrogenase YdfG